MSWNSYTDALMNSGIFDQSALMSQRGEEWSLSPDFRIAPNEYQELVETSWQIMTSFKILGIKYQRVKAQKDAFILGREMGIEGAPIFAVFKTHKSLLFGKSKSGRNLNEIFDAMNQQAEKLKAVGF